MAHDLLTALALVLILEGLLPTVSPGTWLKMMQDAARLGPRAIRWVGVTFMLAGAILLQLLH
ncbi:MAG: DUF2065 family protein [Xanthomonadales bacterium]|nr:DUF2065 family protein [Xanthomonadales bacterium]NIN60784.1 DUF2065 family protein [Xanthomonadales bacterium]NIN76146.1 DUF2065 family protein [Xanthomonadales bacterium]NIO15367.1 DUF2065 family protein [Xanthomonadales bacterium]NIP13177.1 DUF2065 family protein [Xanthomonadales bacterium]